MRHCMKGWQPKEPALFKTMAVLAIGCGRTMSNIGSNDDTAGDTLGCGTKRFAMLELDLIDALNKLGMKQDPFLTETQTLADTAESQSVTPKKGKKGAADLAVEAGSALKFTVDGFLDKDVAYKAAIDGIEPRAIVEAVRDLKVNSFRRAVQKGEGGGEVRG